MPIHLPRVAERPKVHLFLRFHPTAPTTPSTRSEMCPNVPQCARMCPSAPSPAKRSKRSQLSSFHSYLLSPSAFISGSSPSPSFSSPSSSRLRAFAVSFAFWTKRSQNLAQAPQVRRIIQIYRSNPPPPGFSARESEGTNPRPPSSPPPAPRRGAAPAEPTDPPSGAAFHLRHLATLSSSEFPPHLGQ